MSWFSKAFGRYKRGDQGALDVMTASGIETMLRAHLRRLDSAYQGRPGAKDLRRLCDQLLAGDRLSFAVGSIQQNLPDTLAKKAQSNATKLFTDWFVAVTVCPWLTVADVRAHLRGGYLALLGGLTASAQPGGRHIAHWIYCSDGKEAGVHLTLIPNPKVMRTVYVIAEDLLTPDERKQLGVSHLA